MIFKIQLKKQEVLKYFTIIIYFLKIDISMYFLYTLLLFSIFKNMKQKNVSK